MKKQVRLTVISISVLAVIIAAILIVGKTGILDNSFFQSEESVREYIDGFGAWAPLIFVLIQILQVIIAPVPGNITTIAGGSLFGFIKGFMLGHAGIYIGGAAAFWIARELGQKVVVRLVGKSAFEKYNSVFKGRSVWIIFLAYLIPVIPDDILCFLTGLSSMSFGIFSITFFFGRMPGTILSALMGAGAVDFSLKQFFLIGSVILTVMVIFSIYRKDIERRFMRRQELD